MTARPGCHFERIVGPVGLEAFLGRYWEREPLHIARGEPGFYADFFDLDDLDGLLFQSRISSPDLRVESKERGRTFEAIAGVDRPQLDRRRGPTLGPLYAAFAGGESIVVRSRRLSPAISRLCRSVEQIFRREGSAELFLTPRRSQAFDIHFDLHDVFLLQLDGAKTWHIYEPIIEHPAPANVVGKRHCGDRVGEPMAVFEVRKGDLLYIPHGFPHQGITSDEASLHVTVGVTTTYVYELLKALAEAAAREHAVLRRPMPRALADPAATGVDKAMIAEHLRLLASDDLIDKAIERLEESFLDELDPLPDGQFGEVNRVGEMTGESVLEWRPDQLCAVRCDSGAATIHFVGNKIAGPAWLEASLRWIAATPRFRVHEIPGDLSLDSKLVLARRLVKEGFLRQAQASGDAPG